jgi:hypothetical protein
VKIAVLKLSTKLLFSIRKHHTRTTEGARTNKASYFVIALAIILACSIAANVYFYTQYHSNAQSNAETAFKSEFGNVFIVSPNYIFSPPITMYRALQIGLESDQWNAASLINLTVTVALDYMEFSNSSTFSGEQFMHEVKQPVQSYADVQVNSTTTYRYIWSISVTPDQGITIPPYGLYYVDAQTGQIIPHGILV